METAVIRRLRIQTYREQLFAYGDECATLKKELEREDLPGDQMLTMGDRLDEVTKESLSLKFMIAHLEQVERVAAAG